MLEALITRLASMGSLRAVVCSGACTVRYPRALCVCVGLMLAPTVVVCWVSAYQPLDSLHTTWLFAAVAVLAGVLSGATHLPVSWLVVSAGAASWTTAFILSALWIEPLACKFAPSGARWLGVQASLCYMSLLVGVAAARGVRLAFFVHGGRATAVSHKGTRLAAAAASFAMLATAAVVVFWPEPSTDQLRATLRAVCCSESCFIPTSRHAVNAATCDWIEADCTAESVSYSVSEQTARSSGGNARGWHGWADAVRSTRQCGAR